MISKVYSAIPYGYDGKIIEVESSMNNSLPAFNIVGMANKTVSEARERVRAAITNSGLIFPAKKITINLAPAELTKTGTHLDLPIAVSVLTLAQHILPLDLNGKLFVGELSLDGLLRPVRGIINIIEAAKAANFQEVYLPIENLPQAQLIPDIRLIGVRSLQDLVLHLNGSTKIAPPPKKTPPPPAPLAPPFLDDVKGQSLAKRALAIAIAGHHNLLLSGPPGAGKTLLARVAANLLPTPTPDEAIAIAKIHSLQNTTSLPEIKRPFRAPHHTASHISLIGGGTQVTPGEITLAHHGILFLDELPEYPRSVLESLRQPLEDKVVTINRAAHHVTYPANFMLIATMNPCPCGYLTDPTHECHCTQSQITNYHHKLSGPILDRIDLIINIDKVKTTDLASSATTPIPTVVKNTKTSIRPEQHQSSANVVENTKTVATTTPEHTVVKNNITYAIQIQFQRYKRAGFYNSSLSSHDIQKYAQLSLPAQSLLQTAADKLNLSARSYFKIIKVARTIADLAAATEIKPEHISESIALREQLRY